MAGNVLSHHMAVSRCSFLLFGVFILERRGLGLHESVTLREDLACRSHGFSHMGPGLQELVAEHILLREFAAQHDL